MDYCHLNNDKPMFICMQLLFLKEGSSLFCLLPAYGYLTLIALWITENNV